jgi:hypothetical protein
LSLLREKKNRRFLRAPATLPKVYIGGTRLELFTHRRCPCIQLFRVDLIAPWFTLGIYLQAHDELLVYVDSIDASQEHAVTVNSFIIFFF